MLAGRARHQRLGEGRALRALLRRFNIPLSPSRTCPGFLPGTDQEYGGIIRHGAKLLYAFCEATVPKLTVITRKAYGGAYDVMNSKHIRGDVNLAWPDGRDRGDGRQGRGGDHRVPRELKASRRPGRGSRGGSRCKEYRDKFANPYAAASLGYVDDVIEARRDAERLIRRSSLPGSTKRDTNPPKKHGNIPL